MRLTFFIRILLICFAIVLLAPLKTSAQEEHLYDEITLYLEIPRIGGGDLPALIKGEEAFLSITDLFDYLKIKNTPSEDLFTVSGFFIDPEATYTIDRRENTITYQDKLYNLETGDLVRSETGLYLRSSLFGKIFGLDCKFSFRTLSVKLETRLELPLIKEMRQETLRQNISKLKGEIKADTIIGRTYPHFRFGMADWSVITNEQIKGQSNARINLKLGAVIAGGEATASLNYYSRDPFNEKQQYYLWRYVNNDNTLWKQIIAGKINTGAISSIYNPVIGAQITNTPTTFRRSFGSYTLSNKTNPGWVVELYVNNVLVDYVKADASGFYSFEVPLVYGNSMIKLKFYGPWGEEESQEQNITIPYAFVPNKTLEYTASAGMVEDTLHSIFSRGNVNYGLTSGITVGGGVEYLSSVTSGPVMPFINTSLRITKNLLASAEYTYGVRAKGTLTYRLPSNVQFDLNYTWYDRDQTAINYKYLEERKAMISVPIKVKRFFAYSRLTYYQIVLPTTKYTTGEWLLSGSVFGVNTNLTTYALFIGNADPNIYSNIAVSFRIPGSFTVIPQVQYGFTQKQLYTAKLAVEKHLLGNGFLNLSFERNFRSNYNAGEIGFRYDFSFAQAGVSVRQGNNTTTLVQYARGSFINDSRTKYFKADNRTNVGTGGVTILPYLDINANMTYDTGEPKVTGLNVQSSGGRIIYNIGDTTIRILNLEPYTKYFVELSESGFDNIAWKIKNKTLSIVIDPDQLKLIEVPVSVEGEATGNVAITHDSTEVGIGRIIVNFYRTPNKLIGHALTEPDGYFSFFGLAPGSYNVRIDSVQLRKLKMTSSPESLFFKVKPGTEGDYIDGLNFKLTIKAEIPVDTTRGAITQEKTVRKDTSYLVVHEVSRELVTIKEDFLSIQLGAFRVKANADRLKKKIADVIDKNVEIIYEDGLYKVRITGFKDREELNGYIPTLQKLGIKEMWVVTNKAKKEYWVTKTRQDSIAKVEEEQKKPGSTIQVGSFTNKEDVDAAIDRLLAAVEEMVTVRKEGDSYKVQITEIRDTARIRELIPSLNDRGFRNLIVIHPDLEGTPPVVVPRDTALVEPMRDTAFVKPEIKAEAPPVNIPRFLLHAAKFYKHHLAVRAQKRIERKLKMPVEIIKDWDAYRVVITGFFTREDTYKYYPELVGLGYHEVFVIERSPQKK